MTRSEKQREANYRWRIKNREFLKAYDKERYQRNRDKILKDYREKNPPKPKKEKVIIPVFIAKKEYRLFEITEILKKDLRHRLWYLPIVNWKENDWNQFHELKAS